MFKSAKFMRRVGATKWKQFGRASRAVKVTVALVALGLSSFGSAQAATVNYAYSGTLYAFSFDIETTLLPGTGFDGLELQAGGANSLNLPSYVQNWSAPTPWVALSRFTMTFASDGSVMDWSYTSHEETNSSEAGLWGEREQIHDPLNMVTVSDIVAPASPWIVTQSSLASAAPPPPAPTHAPIPMPIALLAAGLVGLGVIRGRRPAMA